TWTRSEAEAQDVPARPPSSSRRRNFRTADGISSTSSIEAVSGVTSSASSGVSAGSGPVVGFTLPPVSGDIPQRARPLRRTPSFSLVVASANCSDRAPRADHQGGSVSEWSPPSALGGYRIVRPLGRGGMGRVFLGHDTLLDRAVAIKFIAAAEPGPDWRERFLTEGRAVARLSHPNVVAVYRVGEVAGRPYLITEYVDG